METATLVLLGLLLSDVDAPTVRDRRPNGVWFEPQLRFHSIGGGHADLAGSDMSALPLGVEVGRQLRRPLLLSIAFAQLPVANIRTSQVTAGARWTLRDAALSPTLAAEVGVLVVEVDDTGGLTHTDLFVAVGPGLELALRNGLSLVTDLQLGPENTGDARSTQRTWNFSAWYRLGVGYRF